MQRDAITKMLADAGVTIGGPAPWDITVHDERFYGAALRRGTLGAGESYMDGWWDCPAIDQLVARVQKVDLGHRLGRSTLQLMIDASHRLRNRQVLGRRSEKVAELHYNLGNEMFAAMIGPTMNYSCAYWHNAPDLDAAQTAKMDLICRKLELHEGHHLLDIGCGWGGLARHAASRYGCRVTGITNSREQAAGAGALCRGLPVDIKLMDYRDPTLDSLGPFDRIVSVGMFEHVGHKNYAAFMDVCYRLLPQGSLLLLHSIGKTVDTSVDPWVDRYIFPNSYLPTMADIATMAHGKMILEDWHNFGADYDRTLMAWHERFEKWADTTRLAERARRMWRYYLLTFAGTFRVRDRIQLWQMLFSKGGDPGGYVSVR